MDSLFDFIFENMFLVIIIISGIIGLLSRNKEEQKKQQQKRPQRPQQRRAPANHSRTQSASSDRSREPVKEQQVYRSGRNVEEQEGNSSPSIAAEQQAQMESLEKRYGITSKNLSSEDLSQQDLKFDEPLKPLDILSKEQERLKSNLRSNLKNKGLINGIIMAEVLGKPRSLKSYRSPTLERYNK